MTEGTSAQGWPGERLGLPEGGPGAVAGWGRRLLAVAVDWFLSLMVVGAFVGTDVWSGRGAVQWAPLAVFAAERWLLTSLLGGSAGQLLCRIRVTRTHGGLLGVERALVRTVLLCLVIPPVIYNRDQRGLHDLAVDSVTVRV
ncbi:MAG: RDD family protein [Nocardioidaceae bacterium]